MIPQPIYALLPYIYMVIGVFGLIGLESDLGKLCGLVLIATGIVVQQLRARYRVDNRLLGKPNPKHPPEPSVAAAEPRSRRSMPEPRSRRSMPEPRSVRTDRFSSR